MTGISGNDVAEKIKLYKIDVYQQLRVKWDHFANYVWSEYQKKITEADKFGKKRLKVNYGLHNV
jgi:hypothetical protein